MRFTANDIEGLKLEMARALDELAAAGTPTRLYAATTAGMPAAADWTNCVLRNTTLNILAVSDGTNWRRQDTGAVI